MLLVDPRAGSVGLVPLLTRLGLPVEQKQMPFGDFAFLGNGPSGKFTIGIEYKKLGDMLKCITDHRFIAHQLPGMLAAYDMCWLLVEGLWRPNPSNLILEQYTYGGWRPTRGRKMMYGDLHKYLLSITVRGRFHVERSSSEMESAAIVQDLYRWWTAKKWDQHQTPHAFDESKRFTDTALLVPPSTFRELVATMPGIGWERSKYVVRHFRDLREAVNAPASEWAKIPGIGPITAARVQSAILAGRKR